MRWLFVLLAPLLASLSACATHAFTPSARPMPLTPALTPGEGNDDVQLDGNASGEVLGPGIAAGNLRYRHGVTDTVAITGDLGAMRASGDNSSENPFAATARAGVQVGDEIAEDLDGSVFAGVGGGYAPAAGSWVSADAGGVIAGDHKWVRPMLLVDVYASQPVGAREFAVGDEMLILPRTFGVQGLAGFDLGRRERSVMIGLAVAQLWGAATAHQEAESATFIGLGGGFRFAPN